MFQMFLKSDNSRDFGVTLSRDATRFLLFERSDFTWILRDFGVMLSRDATRFPLFERSVFTVTLSRGAIFS